MSGCRSGFRIDRAIAEGGKKAAHDCASVGACEGKCGHLCGDSAVSSVWTRTHARTVQGRAQAGRVQAKGD
eukprot:364344-Chlamydomonas_euryale.AAC.25